MPDNLHRPDGRDSRIDSDLPSSIHEDVVHRVAHVITDYLHIKGHVLRDDSQDQYVTPEAVSEAPLAASVTSEPENPRLPGADAITAADQLLETIESYRQSSEHDTIPNAACGRPELMLIAQSLIRVPGLRSDVYDALADYLKKSGFGVGRRADLPRE